MLDKWLGDIENQSIFSIGASVSVKYYSLDKIPKSFSNKVALCF